MRMPSTRPRHGAHQSARVCLNATSAFVSWRHVSPPDVVRHTLVEGQVVVLVEPPQQGQRPSPKGGRTRSPMRALPYVMFPAMLAGTSQSP